MTIPETTPRSSVTWPDVQRAAILTAAFVLLIWIMEAVDFILPVDMDYWGVVSWSPTGLLPGLILMPLLHIGFGHLIGNTLPILVLGFLSAAKGLRSFFIATAVIMVVCGVGVWLTSSPGTYSAGASGMVYGYFGYLVACGVLNRNWWDIVIAIVVAGLATFYYGYGVVWGLLPTNTTVSWQGHLFGLVGGLFAAWMLRPKIKRSAG